MNYLNWLTQSGIDFSLGSPIIPFSTLSEFEMSISNIELKQIKNGSFCRPLDHLLAQMAINVFKTYFFYGTAYAKINAW